MEKKSDLIDNGQYLNDELVFYLSYAVSLAGITQAFFLVIFNRPTQQ